ncbi:DUF4267 domain-containing protein [Kitasatospora sp. NPDC091207]|uniref:DUF4267 domain-containing protein n=1 Tax=Kitasatospora sp. NPDC091207 TaxID=3364083 RepID=UPI00380F4708
MSGTSIAPTRDTYAVSAAGTTGTTGTDPATGTVRRRIATVLTVLIALGIGYVGVSYLFVPESTVSGFGLPEWPHGDAAAFFSIKGIRDLATGIAPLVLLATGQRRALGWLLLVEALIPLDDAVTVLTHHGSTAAALGIHAATALLVAATAALLLTEHRTAPRTPAA